MKWPVESILREELLLDVDRERLFLFAVNHGGYPAIAAQCSGGSLASPVARFGGQRQLIAHFAILRLLKMPRHASRDDHGREARALVQERSEKQVCGRVS